MSTEQPLDPQLIEQTKQQIRSLVGEIAQLSKSEISPEEFYSEFLTRVVSALAAVGGVVWTTNQDGQLALQYQINLQETRLRESEEAQAQHSRLLYKVLIQRRRDYWCRRIPAQATTSKPAIRPISFWYSAC